MSEKKEKAREILHIDTIVHEGIPNRMDITEYRSGDSMLIVTHRYDGISEKHLATALHTHTYYELEVVYEGRGVQIVGTSSFPMCRGRACLRAPSNPHTTHEDPLNPLRSFNLRFSADFIPRDIPTRLLTRGGAVSVLWNEEELLLQIERMKRTAFEIRRNDAYSRLTAESLLHEVLADFARKCDANGNEHAAMSRRISDVLRCIDENFRNDISVALLARKFGLNPHYLGSLFIAEVGKSIPQYVRDMRLALAAQLLSASSLSVSEIAYECGFSSPSYFISKFREQYGTTPRGYAGEGQE